MRSYDIQETIGRTPMVRLTRLSENPRVRICGKLEGSNPGGSVKDRAARYMIKKAEESGELSLGKIVRDFSAASGRPSARGRYPFA